jgi:PAS domain-containing protein
VRRGYWAEIHLYPRDGGMEVYFSDISGRKQAEENLRASEEKYRSLFESMIEAYCVIEMIFDDNGRPVDFRYLETNAAFTSQESLTLRGMKLLRSRETMSVK